MSSTTDYLTVFNRERMQQIFKPQSISCRSSQLLCSVIIYFEETIKKFLCYSLEDQTQRIIGNNCPSRTMSSFCVSNGILYVLSYEDHAQSLDKPIHIYSYSITNNKWKHRITALAPRYFLQEFIVKETKYFLPEFFVKEITVFDDTFYALGYGDSDDSDRNCMCYFDIVSSTWFPLSHYKFPSHSRIVTSKKYIYVVGMTYNLSDVVVEKYSPYKQTWKVLPTMHHRHESSPAVFYNNKLYVFGGINRQVEYWDEIKEKWVLVSSQAPANIHDVIVQGDLMIAISFHYDDDNSKLCYTFYKYSPFKRKQWEELTDTIFNYYDVEHFGLVSMLRNDFDKLPEFII